MGKLYPWEFHKMQHFHPEHKVRLIITASFNALGQQLCIGVTHHLAWKTADKLH